MDLIWDIPGVLYVGISTYWKIGYLPYPNTLQKMLITCNIIAMEMHTIKDTFTVVIPLIWFINKLYYVLQPVLYMLLWSV